MLTPLRIPNLERMNREDREELAKRFIIEARAQEKMADDARNEAVRLAVVNENAIRTAHTLRQLARAARSFDSVPEEPKT